MKNIGTHELNVELVFKKNIEKTNSHWKNFQGQMLSGFYIFSNYFEPDLFCSV